MKSVKKESRLRISPNRFLEAAESLKEKKRAKVSEQPTPPIQEEPEPVSNVLQGDDILALAVKKEDLRKQHIPRLIETEDKAVITQKFIIRKLKPKDSRKKVCHLVAHPATPDTATKPLDYSGPGDSFHGSDQILPHHILGSLEDFKRIAVARGNTQLAELIHTPPCLMTLISAKEELKQKAPKEEKAHPWAPPRQHNFLKNWQRNIALRKKQQEALSERLKKPVGELLMHTGETYRQIQEERELIDRILPTRHDGKGHEETNGFWSPLEYLGDEMTGLVMTKTKTQRGLMEPITHIRKPHSIQAEMGLLAQKDAWYRYTWDRSLFLIYRRKELQSLMAELNFSQQDIDGLEVVGRGQPFSTVTVEDYPVFERNQESSSEDTVTLDSLASYPDEVPMPVLGPSLLFCGKPACWIRGSNPEDKKHVGIAVRLTFETLEGEKTSSELTVVNNGTVAIWYDWRRRCQLDSFQDLKRNRLQRFYFNSRAGVILPGETKNFTFFFKSVNAGIFRECWEFGTHPTLLGGALLQVTLHAVSLAQDILKDERKLLESKLAAHEAVTIVESVLQELLRGILTPERAQSPVDAYLTEEDLFSHRNPRLHYQYQVVQNLHRLWHQYAILPPKEARLGEEEHLSPGALAAMAQPAYLEKASVNVESSGRFKSPVLESQLAWQEDSQDFFGSQKTQVEAGSFQQKSIMEDLLVEGSPDLENVRSPWELDGLPRPEWNLCLEDFRKAVMALPEENQREDALIRLNKAALELCQEQRPLQSDFLYQMCLQLWRDVIDSLVSHSLWLRALLGLPEKETTYLDVPGEQGRKSPPVIEVKVASGRVGKEDRRGAAQEKKQLGVRDKEDKKGAKQPGKEDRLNSKKQKAKDDKKPMKPSFSRDRLFLEDPAPDSTTPSQEPIDPLVMEKYTQRLHTEVYELLDTLVTNLVVLADELSPVKNVGELCVFEPDSRAQAAFWETG
ncbi:PREDICTED: LOW QUALITY PROTEIN: MYCBP-associated protein [Ceratotherium simum simum]|uniref:LOW QUALITY PROTEIN: MYCBP-associated protein n=1 Tax=Ceratotherium simum simum TaxID=73337 RepID=A0ABM1D3C3_CERSS|nr:PREDICTED: LOW QUALITY PROTEIN: MYCBP-associated protein [Ceratotherium simum simum]